MQLFGKTITYRKVKSKIKKYFNFSRDFIIRDIFSKNTLPDFLIIGSQKCGSSALAFYLSQHPKITQAYRKEVAFFNSVRYHNGLNWYKKQFPGKIKNTKYFEATPDYIYFPHTAERIYNYKKDLKIIIILRDPVKRAISAWNHFREVNIWSQEKRNYSIKIFIEPMEEKETMETMINFLNNPKYPDLKTYIEFERALIETKKAIEPSFIRKGFYFEQLKEFLKYFSLDQMLILENKELKDERKKTLKKAFHFIGVKEQIDIPKLNEIGKRNYSYEDDDSIQILSKIYKPHNEKLFELIGKRYNWI